MKSTRIVVSVCSGRSGTEMQGDDLCICLDTDKKSLFASVVASKYLYSKKNNVIFHHHNMKENLAKLFHSLHELTKIPVTVLFQHPNPSKDSISTKSIALACKDCVEALHSATVDSVHFTYDSSSKNCWTEDRLKKIIFSKCSLEMEQGVSVSVAKCICKTDEKDYTHPVFGTVTRTGWSLMKKGQEMGFLIIKA